ncbi:DUF5455 family protein [Pseudomonas sp. M30-35]|uniref:DUF5455 family protein n=1 Tax=Pseudomonas sp. M30-35 TaxID=1981174 RepID=UPI000B3BF230|nr:DUF5455 family protein [Pseudomonas sp. M30-35]ARU88507.1 hypothetical protein B9K09_11270 [Pseudomonas sp. M30-35]ARU88516.1 hypothetical protein B9K09_11315 [Pseudomonas sp. M30-35]
MAIPLVVAGIPWLATVLGGLFAALLSFFVRFFTKKFALTAAFAAGSLVLFGTFFSVIWGLLQGLNYVAPAEVGMAFRIIVPNNFVTCMGAYLTARIARWVYDWNTRVLQFRLNL